MKLQFKILNWFNIRIIFGNDFRAKGHDAFDPLWQKGFMSRNEAYRWLSQEMDLDRENCHFSLFNEGQCNEAVKICNNYIVENTKDK